LDLAALSSVLLPRNNINRIRYFTAQVSARPHDPQQPVRQQTYLRALQTIPGLSIDRGQRASARATITLGACRR
jgi:predicted ATPase